MQIKVLIVDDEPHARGYLKELLAQEDEVLLLGEAKNGQEAIQTIEQLKPDLVFLDVQMPGINGFGVLEQLSNAPIIIFTTAFDQFAIQAFEASALDYLLKPFSEERFFEALERAKKQLELTHQSSFNHQMMQLVQNYQQVQSKYLTTLEVKEKLRSKHIPVADIYWLEANDVYVNIHGKSNKYLYRASLNSLETNLHPELFLRIHRAYIIQVNYITNTQYLNNNKYEFTLANGQKLTSSRSYKEKIVDFLDNQ